MSNNKQRNSIKITPSYYQWKKISQKTDAMKISDRRYCKSIVLNDILNKVFSGELCTKEGKNYFEDVLQDSLN